jgi:hypothetical protein
MDNNDITKKFSPYQALLVPVVSEYALLVNELSLLHGTTTDKFYKLLDVGHLHAYEVIRQGLVNQCIIRSHQLLQGNGGLENRRKTTPSLRLLIHPFLKKSESQYLNPLNQIRHHPLFRDDLILHLEDLPKNHVVTSPASSNLEQDFWERIETIRTIWAVLENKRTELDDPRNQVSAHLELKAGSQGFNSLDEQGTATKKTYETFDFALRPSLSKLYDLLNSVINPIGNCLKETAWLLAGVNLDVKRIRNEAQRDATVFWSHQPSV